MKYHRYEDFIKVIVNNKDINIIANKEVNIQKNSLEQLEKLDLQLTQLSSEEYPIELQYIGTPDFHKGSIIPIGTTVVSNYFIPKLMGNDINCGMQFLATSLNKNKITANVMEQLTLLNRCDYFGGSRGVRTDADLRKSIIEHGIQALHNIENYKKDTNGIWATFDKISLLPKQEHPKRSSIDDTNIFNDWIYNSCEYDSQLGSIGGGNHFVEYLYVEEIFDNNTAKNLGVKQNAVVILVHSGSLGFGHAVNILIEDYLKEFWSSKSKGKRPPILGLPPSEKTLVSKLFNNIKKASNFASVNRAILAAMAFRNLQKVSKTDMMASVITDSSHNMIDMYSNKFRHRKEACSANKDEIILIPGSMGTSSYLCLGTGNKDTYCVSSHGSGRAFSRGESMKKNENGFKEWMSSYPVVTPIDFNKITNNLTKQLKTQQLMQESPVAYKDIEPTINSQVTSGMITKVARLKSLMTIKSI